MKLKKGDTVVIISGKERGKKGKITRVYPGDFRISVEGVGMRKKHRKPTKSGEKGQVIEKQSPLASAKAMFLCPKCGKAARLGYKIAGKNKARICKKCGADV